MSIYASSIRTLQNQVGNQHPQMHYWRVTHVPAPSAVRLHMGGHRQQFQVLHDELFAFCIRP